MSYWTLVITQANKERLAAQNIANQKFEYYLPMFRERISKKDIVTEVAKPLFQRYIFVNIVQQWSPLTGTYGVSGLLMEGSSPKIVPERVIEKLKARHNKDGFIELDQDDGSLKKDSLVKVTSGPLEGHIGIYQGMSSDERAVVLFKMLGSERELKVSPKILVSA